VLLWQASDEECASTTVKGGWSKATVRRILLDAVQPGGSRLIEVEDSRSSQVRALPAHSPDLQLAMKDRGMTIAQLLRFAEECQSIIASRSVLDPREHLDEEGTPNPDFGQILNFEKAPTWLIVELFVKPVTKEDGVPFVDAMAKRWPDLGGPRQATHFISHSWKQAFNEQLVTLPRLGDDAVVWICSFAMTQHEERLELLDDSEVFSQALIASTTKAQVLLLDRELQALTRMWVLFEVLRGQQHNKVLEILPHDLLCKTRLMNCAIELERASCTSDEDCKYIRAQLEAVGLASVNERVREAVLHAMVQLVHEMEEEYGPASAEAAESHYNLGIFYREHGKYDQAIYEIDMAREVKVALFGEDHPDVYECDNARGTVLRRQGRLEASEETHFRCVGRLTLMLSRLKPVAEESAETQTQPDSPTSSCYSRWAQEFRNSVSPRSMDGSPGGSASPSAAYLGGSLLLSRAQSDMGSILRRRGKLAEAEAAHRTALQLRRKSLGIIHPDVAESHMHLGLVLWEQGKLQEAEVELREALEVQEKELGQEHPEVARTHNRLGLVLQDLGDLASAEEELKKALAIRLEQLGHDHPDVATTRTILGNLLERLDKLHEAEEEAGKALEIRQSQLGPDHIDVSRCHNCLGAIYRKQGKLTESERQHRRALEIQEAQVGLQHLQVANSTTHLGLVLRRRRELVEAEAMLRRALAIYIGQLGEDNINTAKCRAHLGLVLQDRGDLKEAEVQIQDALRIQVGELRSDHLDIARSRNRLALVRQKQGDLQGAEDLLRAALEPRISQLGSEHRDVATTRTILGSVLRMQRRYPEALEELNLALQVRLHHLGPLHVDVAQSRWNLGMVQEDMGNLDEAKSEYALACDICVESADYRECLSRVSDVKTVVAVFEEFDRASSGTIELSLLMALFARLEPRWSTTDVQQLVKACGLHVEGRISYRQFVHGIFRSKKRWEEDTAKQCN